MTKFVVIIRKRLTEFSNISMILSRQLELEDLNID